MAEPTQPETPEVIDENAMPFVEHLRELRDRLRNSVIALLFGFLGAYFFKETLAALLLRPYQNSWKALQATNPAFSEPPAVYFSSIVEPFWTYFTLSLWAGLFLSSPFIFYQIWKFVAPGLYRQERRYGLLFAVASGICFSGGAVFCYLVVLEPVYQYLLDFATTNLSQISSQAFETGAAAGAAAGASNPAALPLKPLLTIQEYMSFARRLLLAFGLVFELPLGILFLSLIGVVTHRSLWRFNRWWTVLSFVVSAMLTPPDLFSQVVMAGPLIVLYNVSIVLAYIVTTRREAREAALLRYEGARPDPDKPS